MAKFLASFWPGWIMARTGKLAAFLAGPTLGAAAWWAWFLHVPHADRWLLRWVVGRRA